MKKKCTYIVLEGLDGSGKTTLFNNLNSFFVKDNISFQTLCPTRICSPNSILEKIYRANKIFKKINFCRTIIFAYRSYKSSRQTNWNSDLVFGDRSIIVSYVKHWRKYFNSPFLSVALVNFIEPFIKTPDFVLLLDAPENILIKRLALKDIIEVDETPENLRLMKNAYKEIRYCYKISRLAKIKWIDIDSNKSPSVLANEVYQIIKNILNNK